MDTQNKHTVYSNWERHWRQLLSYQVVYDIIFLFIFVLFSWASAQVNESDRRDVISCMWIKCSFAFPPWANLNYLLLELAFHKKSQIRKITRHSTVHRLALKIIKKGEITITLFVQYFLYLFFWKENKKYPYLVWYWAVSYLCFAGKRTSCVLLLSSFCEWDLYSFMALIWYTRIFF